MRNRVLPLLLTALLAITLIAGTYPASVTAQGELTRTKCKEDLKGQTIMFHSIGDLSGPYAPITQPLVAGLNDAIKYYNGQGGLCGAEIKLMQDDTAGKQEQTKSLYDRYKALDPKPLMILMFNSADGELLRQQVVADKIPILLSAGSTIALYGEKANEPGYIFATIPLYADQFGAFCRWLGKAWTTELKKEGAPKVGHLSWEGPFGRSSETPQTTAYCKAQGVEVVGGEYFLPTATDVTTQINNLLSKGANVLFTTSLATGTALIASDLVTLGKEDSVMLAGVNWVLDTSVGLLGARKLKKSGVPSTDGVIGILPYSWWDEESPGTKLVKEQFAANKRAPTLRNIAYISGYGFIDTYIELITQTVNRVGSKGLNGEAVFETLKTFKYDSLGGVFKYSYSENGRAQNQIRIGMLSYAKDKDGKLMIVDVGGTKIPVPVIGPVTKEWSAVPDLRPGGADVPK
jgi:ABC-type branched-subunit amino acid transport system substrate-binding protein